nr:hypothetical protein [Luteimicrobium album]
MSPSTARAVASSSGCTYGALSARTATSDTWCATTSCRSWAARARSDVAASAWRASRASASAISAREPTRCCQRSSAPAIPASPTTTVTLAR